MTSLCQCWERRGRSEVTKKNGHQSKDGGRKSTLSGMLSSCTALHVRGQKQGNILDCVNCSVEEKERAESRFYGSPWDLKSGLPKKNAPKKQNRASGVGGG